MKIGIIGAGAMAQTYAKLWIAAGHSVFLSSRNPQKLTHVAAGLGPNAQAGFPAQAAAYGDVVVLMMNYAGLDQAIAAIAAPATGKLVIDATNPLGYDAAGGLQRLIPEDAVAGEVMAANFPEARIAKAFTTLWTGHVENHADRAAPSVAMSFAADTAADRETVSVLIDDAGLVPVSMGTLAQSKPVDPFSPIWNVVLSEAEMRQRVAADQPAAAA